MITLNQYGVKSFFVYVFSFIFLTLFIYLGIPSFFDYKGDKLFLEKKIFKSFGLNLNLTSEARYNIFPTPRLNLDNVQILNFSNDSNNIGLAKKVVLKIPFKKLVSLKVLDFDAMELIDAVINIETSKSHYFLKYLNDGVNEKPIEIKKIKINLLDKKKLLFSSDLKKIHISGKNLNNKMVIKGKIFNTEVKINYQKKGFNQDLLKNVKVNVPGIGASLKLSINPDKKNSEGSNGSARLFFPNNKIYFEYIFKNKVLSILNSRIINNYFKGQLFGDLLFSPYLIFDYKLDIDFLKFKSILDDSRSIKNNEFLSQLIPFNSKINGNINVNINKIISSSNIINSANIDLEFRNTVLLVKNVELIMNNIGNIKIVGKISQQKKRKLFVYTTKINLDNSQSFYSRFLIPEKNRIDLVPITIYGKIDLDSSKINLDKILFENKSGPIELDEQKLLFLQEDINKIFLQNSLNNVLKYSNLRKIIQSFFN